MVKIKLLHILNYKYVKRMKTFICVKLEFMYSLYTINLYFEIY